MAKYDPLLGELKTKLAEQKNIIIALPALINIDRLSAGLALFLSLQQAGKEVSIISEGTVLVAHSNIFGIGKIQNSLPQISAGNFTLTLQGVVAPDGTVPSLEKLDWFPKGEDLNLVFHVLPGQTFQPKQIIPTYEGGGTNLTIIVGGSNLNDLGGIYTNNSSNFTNSYLVNIDNNPSNANFGKVNIVDPTTPALSEVISQVIQGLNLPLNQDIASNILAGIYFATNNLTVNVTPETFVTVGQAMQAGGKLPALTQPEATVQSMQQQPAPQAFPQPTAQSQPAFDYRSFMQATPGQQMVTPQPMTPQPNISNDTYSVPPVVNPVQAQSTQETPTGEFASTTAPETPESQPAPDWLTPKVYKGTQLG